MFALSSALISSSSFSSFLGAVVDLTQHPTSVPAMTSEGHLLLQPWLAVMSVSIHTRLELLEASHPRSRILVR